MALFFQVKGDFFVVAQQNGAECWRGWHLTHMWCVFRAVPAGGCSSAPQWGPGSGSARALSRALWCQPTPWGCLLWQRGMCSRPILRIPGTPVANKSLATNDLAKGNT
jgi:hypothetical protein